MKLTESKALSILVMVVLIAGSTAYGGIRKVDKLADKVNEEFVTGEKGDGLSIARDLDTRVQRANNILQIAKNYLGQSDSEIETARKYISVIEDSKAASTPYENKSELYEANKNLQSNIDSIIARLKESDISEKNLKSINQDKSVFDNALNTIGYDPYNQLVAEYESKTDTFVGKLWRQFASEVQYFR